MWITSESKVSGTRGQALLVLGRMRVPRSRSFDVAVRKNEETWIVDGAITATSTVLPQTA